MPMKEARVPGPGLKIGAGTGPVPRAAPIFRPGPGPRAAPISGPGSGPRAPLLSLASYIAFAHSCFSACCLHLFFNSIRFRSFFVGMFHGLKQSSAPSY